jgi:hypothetical protein
MEREANGKFKSSAPPGASTSGEDASGTGETRYEEPAESLAAASMPALPSGAGHKNAEDASIKNDESAEVQTGEGGGGTHDEYFRRQMSKDRADYERQIAEYQNRLDAQQRRIDDLERHRLSEDRLQHTARWQEATERDIEEEQARLRSDQRRRTDDLERHRRQEAEDRLHQREITARRQEATERDIEEERARSRSDDMRRNRAIAKFGRSIPCHKLKMQTLSGDPAQVHDQIKSSMESQFLGSYSGDRAEAYAKGCATIAENAECLDELSPQFDAYDPSFHQRLATATADDSVWELPEAAAAKKAVSEQFSIIAGTLRSLRHSNEAFNTAVTQAEKAPEENTSRFVQDVLEMMKLQAPGHDFDKDPRMKAEAALTDEFNFITGEGRFAKFQNITPGQRGYPGSNAGALEFWLATQRAVSAKAPGNVTASKQLLLQMLLRALPTAIKNKGNDERLRQQENGVLEEFDIFLVRIKRMAAFADTKNQERGDNGAEEARNSDAKKKAVEKAKLKANMARKAPGKVVMCFSCGSKDGHMASDCPLPTPPGETRCYSCKELGHRATDCPSKNIHIPQRIAL